MNAIGNLDIGSGLDLSELYNKLQNAEMAKLDPITNEATACKNKISAFGQLKSCLQNLQTAMEALTKLSAFNATAVSSTNTAFTASTNSNAVPGSYQITVEQLASAQSLLSGKINSHSEPLGNSDGGTRTLTLKTGDGDPVEITLSDDETSLDGIVNAINKSDAGVTATSVRASDGEYYLQLTAKDTGADNDITVSVSGDDALQSVIGYSAGDATSGMTLKDAGQNAKLTVNGIEVVSKTNTVTNAPDGVTLKLNAVSSVAETLEVSTNTEDTVKAVKDWVAAYNKLQSLISSLTSYAGAGAATTDTSTNGPLMGDNTVRNIQSRLQSMLSQSQDGAYSILAQLGITIDPTKQSDGSSGALVVDETRLENALKDNPQAVADFFIGDGKKTGLATEINNSLSDMLSDTTDKKGMLANAIDSLNRNYDGLSKRYDTMQASIDATMARYQTQFTQLNKLMSQMDQTRQYLASQFDSSSDK